MLPVIPTVLQQPVSFALRSPYSFPGLKLPPAPVSHAQHVTLNADGNPEMQGLTLQSYQNNSQVSSTVPASPTYNTGSYGDNAVIVARFTGVGFAVDGNGNPIPFNLPRPNNTRVSLLIQNNTIGVLFYAFGKQADNVSCVGIAAGGSREFDQVVPQGDLSLFALAAGSAIIEYMNNNVS